MKVVSLKDYGAVTNLKMTELPLPELAPDEVMVEIKATSVNPIDWKARLGLLQPMMHWQMPVVLGWDLAGVITQIGSKVSTFKVGDRVLARPDIYPDGRRGTYAEYAAVKEDKLALLPADWTYVQGAAVSLAGLTAWQVIVDQLQVKTGEKVLIQAGAGGVGLFAIQIAKALGAEVVTTASAANRDWLMSLGADEVIDYHTTEITQVLHDLDAVFDTVNQLDAGLAVLKPQGRLVTIAGKLNAEQLAAPQTTSTWWLKPNGQQLATLVDWIQAGKIKIIIDEIFPFTEAGVQAAQRKSEGHHAHGKLVIKM